MARMRAVVSGGRTRLSLCDVGHVTSAVRRLHAPAAHSAVRLGTATCPTCARPVAARLLATTEMRDLGGGRGGGGGGGGAAAAADDSPARAGRVCYVLHGLLGSSAGMRPFVRALSAQLPDYAFVLTDLRRHGGSAGFAAPHTVAAAAADVAALWVRAGREQNWCKLIGLDLARARGGA